ncbi:MAG TPA: hypothetical protein VNQ81_10210 [Povalibacter sp.]|nr:hypothetical protein [Povalibacter sp.]
MPTQHPMRAGTAEHYRADSGSGEAVYYWQPEHGHAIVHTCVLPLWHELMH